MQTALNGQPEPHFEPKDMQKLHLPPFDVKTKDDGGRTAIYDFLRSRYVCLTPEEWVRQHFTHFLVGHKGYPAALMANELTVNVGGVARRCDTVLYNRINLKPRMIVEYKAPHVAITQHVFQQIYAYNSVLRADYLVVSNGLAHYCCHVDYTNMKVDFLQDIPAYSELE